MGYGKGEQIMAINEKDILNMIDTINGNYLDMLKVKPKKNKDKEKKNG